MSASNQRAVPSASQDLLSWLKTKYEPLLRVFRVYCKIGSNEADPDDIAIMSRQEFTRLLKDAARVSGNLFPSSNFAVSEAVTAALAGVRAFERGDKGEFAAEFATLQGPDPLQALCYGEFIEAIARYVCLGGVCGIGSRSGHR